MIFGSYIVRTSVSIEFSFFKIHSNTLQTFKTLETQNTRHFQTFKIHTTFKHTKHNMSSLLLNKQIEVILKYVNRNNPASLADSLSKFDLNLIQLMSLDPNLTSLCSIITDGTYTPSVQPTLDTSSTTQDKLEAKLKYEIEYKEYLIETKNEIKYILKFVSYMFQSCDKALIQFIQEDPRYQAAILKRPLDAVYIYNLIIEKSNFCRCRQS